MFHYPLCCFKTLCIFFLCAQKGNGTCKFNSKVKQMWVNNFSSIVFNIRDDFLFILKVTLWTLAKISLLTGLVESGWVLWLVRFEFPPFNGIYMYIYIYTYTHILDYNCGQYCKAGFFIARCYWLHQVFQQMNLSSIVMNDVL